MKLYVDELTAAYVSGWAHQDSGPMPLVLLVNGRAVAGTTADGYRPDLQQAGFGSAHLAFTFKLRRPGLGTGDRVEIRHAETQTTLYESLFEEARASEVDLAYGLQDSIEHFEWPFWRPLLVDEADGTVSLQGELFLPAATVAEPMLLEDGRPVQASFAPATAEIAGRYWWLDGRVYVSQYRTALGHSRKILRAASVPDSDAASLSLGVVPSRVDLEEFKFAGSERARRVAGGDDTLTRFAGGGLTAALQLLAIAESLPKLPDAAQVLDWGCGAARVLQFVKAERPGWRLHGADIDTVNVQWCQENLGPIASFQTIPLQPPTGYPDETFDLVYGLSVITHLQEATRDAWIKELARIVRKGGTCVLTYMSTFHIYQHGVSKWSLPLYADLSTRGISDHLPDLALGPELAAYYKSTYNTFRNICAAVEPNFEVIARYPRSLLYQDAIVLRRRAT